MRISDWSSDVCSSDLLPCPPPLWTPGADQVPGWLLLEQVRLFLGLGPLVSVRRRIFFLDDGFPALGQLSVHLEIGRASCRKEWVSTCRSRGWPFLKKKTNKTSYQ